jgi:hypothetical protein
MTDRPARLIGVIPLPVAVADFGKIAESYPRGSTVSQVGAHLWVYSAGKHCWGCIACESQDSQDFLRLTGNMRFGGMIVCPDCGSKRCPKASHHDSACTGSNESGQDGSAYA